MIRLAIADDRELLRRGLERMLETESDFEVTVSVGDGHDLFDRLKQAGCDVLILDIDMPGPGFTETLGRMKTRHPDVQVLVLSSAPEERYALRAMKEGARGYLHKDTAPEILFEAIRVVARGGRYVTPRLGDLLVKGLTDDPSQPKHEVLSNREFEVLRLLGAGMTNANAAKKLCLSPKTVQTYRSRIYQKMGFSSLAQLVRYVVENDLVGDLIS